ncbi:CD209 antigen-like protein E [Chanos chanos]|uniref:CD209 antigen-like protein E n=1 Tax=Chanos chanos TaxID=29144 RepID=A0A6J2WL18_CHACN|nr:CD209 antigen-like protein E [Chanos chanos]
MFHGGRCYHFSTAEMNWAESQNYCVTKGGQLVIIRSKEEQDFLHRNTEDKSHWIGLNDLETEGHWVWVNNQTLDETGVQFWRKREGETDEPDNWTYENASGEDCASLGNESGGTDVWYDSSCTKEKKSICEKRTAEVFSVF